MQPRIVIDLDHTICIPNLEEQDNFKRYGLAKPIHKMIENMQILHEKGFYIIIFTARGMLSCKGNIQLAHYKNFRVTKNWLIDNKVPFDELHFGKPYGDYYVDDKSISFEEMGKLCK